ncbi:MAG: hypothetical protein AAB451_00820 [Patescibacteria group bacterium]
MLGIKQKRISIPESHFIFYYLVLNEAPWVRKDGYDIKGQILPGQFVHLIQKEGAQAMATAITIAQKDAKIAQSLPQQGELISRARP